MGDRDEKKPREERKKVEHKGKRVRTGRKHSTVKVQKAYKVDGSKLARVKKSCPRCGPGTWLGLHKGRGYCGKCGYTVFEKR
ncbi:MAG: 30S ribosomal protein S27ae [Candidatus Aenigmarchaeota archaeon]|nr:30S ribosomal protein S27ae [Candidatus Aenigmarchaeota archaeon]